MALEFPVSEDPVTEPITLQSHARDGSGDVNRHTFAFDKVFDPQVCVEECVRVSRVSCYLKFTPSP